MQIPESALVSTRGEHAPDPSSAPDPCYIRLVAVEARPEAETPNTATNFIATVTMDRQMSVEDAVRLGLIRMRP